MGTNYYIESSNPFKTEDVHVGKRSGGWTFAFNGREFKTLNEWRERLNTMAVNERLVNEYGDEVTVDEFWELVEDTKKPWGPNKLTPVTNVGSTRFEDADRCWSEDKFSFSNYEFC